MVAAASESDSDPSDFEPSQLKPAKSSKKSTTVPLQLSKRSKKPAVQSKPSQDVQQTDRRAAHSSGSQVIVDTKVRGLPEFAKIGWTNSFLPTLYDAFYANEKPFDNFFKDSPAFLKIVQNVVSSVYPLVQHEIRGGDLLLKMVRFYYEVTSLQLNLVYSGQW